VRNDSTQAPRQVTWRQVTLIALLFSMLVAGCAAQPTATAVANTPRATFTQASGATGTATGAPSQVTSSTPTPPRATQTGTLTSTATASSQPTAPQARPLRLSSPEYGMQAFLWYRPEVASRDVQLVKQAGFGWLKQGVGWRDVEPSKGSFNWKELDEIVRWMEEQELNLIVRLDHQPAWATGGDTTNGPPRNPEDFGNFCFALASRYKGRIRAYEIWNEPNLAREWGNKAPNPAEYVALLKVAYRRIKEADPGAIVVTAGLTPTGTNDAQAMPDDVYLTRMYQAMGGTSEGYFDALGAHAAGFKAPPETSPDEVAANKDLGGGRWFCFRRVEDLREIMVKYGDADKQIFILEFGWTSDPVHPEYAWHKVTEQQKAEYLVRAYKYAKANWSPWIGLMSLIFIADPAWTEQHEQYWWSITYPGWPDFKPRPAYEALKAMAK